MLSSDPFVSSVARFESAPEVGAWPAPQAVDALLREAARLLFALCRADHRAWFSEADLQCLYYTILRRELPAHGLPACAVHADYACKLPTEQSLKLGKQGPWQVVDLILVIPHTIHRVRGRRWAGELAAALEIKRGHERLREIKDDLAKLALLREAWPNVLVYMIIMGYHSKPEDVAAVERAARAFNVPLLSDNTWGVAEKAAQPELV
jgi:hypothetical protein